MAKVTSVPNSLLDLQVVIVDHSASDGKIPPGKWLHIESCILNATKHTADEEIQFNGSCSRNGVRIIDCGNQKSVGLLMHLVRNLSELWPGVRLEVLSARQYFRQNGMSGTQQHSNHTKYTPPWDAANCAFKQKASQGYWAVERFEADVRGGALRGALKDYEYKQQRETQELGEDSKYHQFLQTEQDRCAPKRRRYEDETDYTKMRSTYQDLCSRKSEMNMSTIFPTVRVSVPRNEEGIWGSSAKGNPLGRQRVQEAYTFNGNTSINATFMPGGEVNTGKVQSREGKDQKQIDSVDNAVCARKAVESTSVGQSMSSWVVVGSSGTMKHLRPSKQAYLAKQAALKTIKRLQSHDSELTDTQIQALEWDKSLASVPKEKRLAAEERQCSKETPRDSWNVVKAAMAAMFTGVVDESPGPSPSCQDAGKERVDVADTTNNNTSINATVEPGGEVTGGNVQSYEGKDQKQCVSVLKANCARKVEESTLVGKPEVVVEYSGRTKHVRLSKRAYLAKRAALRTIKRLEASDSELTDTQRDALEWAKSLTSIPRAERPEEFAELLAKKKEALEWAKRLNSHPKKEMCGEFAEKRRTPQAHGVSSGRRAIYLNRRNGPGHQHF